MFILVDTFICSLYIKHYCTYQSPYIITKDRIRRYEQINTNLSRSQSLRVLSSSLWSIRIRLRKSMPLRLKGLGQKLLQWNSQRKTHRGRVLMQWGKAGLRYGVARSAQWCWGWGELLGAAWAAPPGPEHKNIQNRRVGQGTLNLVQSIILNQVLNQVQSLILNQVQSSILILSWQSIKLAARIFFLNFKF